MQQPYLFTLTDLQTEGDTLKTDVTLDPLHPIFKGHFPDNPILPGACMVQMVKTAVEAYINKKIRLALGHEFKFLSVISPIENGTVRMELEVKPEDNKFRVKAQLSGGEVIFFKFKGVFVQL